MKIFVFALLLLALVSAHRRPGHHGPPGGRHDGPRGHKMWKQHCMTTNSLNTKFDLTSLKKDYKEDPFSFSNDELSVSFSVCGRNQKLEECGSIGACISIGNTLLNGGGAKKEFVDTGLASDVSFEYSNGDFCDVIGGQRWKTIITITNAPDGTPFTVNSVEQGNCTVRISASASNILAKEEPDYYDDDDGENREGRKHSIFIPILGAAALCCCVTCCCCAIRRRCKNGGCKRSGWCRKPTTTTTTTTVTEQVEIPQPTQHQMVELESSTPETPVLAAVQPPPMYPQYQMNPQGGAPFYPAMYYYPQMTQPVVPRESQIDSDEKLAKALQEQINKGAL